jgi:hypothetical protein
VTSILFIVLVYRIIDKGPAIGERLDGSKSLPTLA